MQHVKNKRKKIYNHVVEWLLYIVAYTIIFILITNLFTSIYIDTKHDLTYSVLIVAILSILNKTLKPILVTITIPITGLTWGLFYPFINLFLLKITDWILGPHFQLKDIWIALLVAILLSISNFIIENIVIKPLLKRVKLDE